jgi:hypothetical protein
VAGKARVPRPLRERVARMAGHRCGYCRTPESIAGFRLSIEHIIRKQPLHGFPENSIGRKPCGPGSYGPEKCDRSESESEDILICL